VAQRSWRIEDKQLKELQSLAKDRGVTPSALVRESIRKELAHEKQVNELAAFEDRVSASLMQMRATLQGLFAVVDQLVKVILTCLPEPAAVDMARAKQEGMDRYTRFRELAAKSYRGDLWAHVGENGKNGKGVNGK
jgi:hypothetical protein